MGWGSGSRLASDLISAAKDTIIDSQQREEFYEQMISHFEEFDCDTLDECIGIDFAFDLVGEKMYQSEEDLWSEEE